MKMRNLLMCAITGIGCQLVAGTTYYMDSKTGDDANPGTEMARPIKSLDRVNQLKLGSGDKLLFKAGSRYTGQLKPIGRGDKDLPILIGMYGEGAKPRFDGEGGFEATVHIYNMEYVTVENLEVTNTGKTAEPRRCGVKVQIEDFGTAYGITLRKLHIHDVNGSLNKKKGGGSAVFWQNGGEKIKSRFDGLLIEDCRLERCQRNGICNSGYWQRDKWFPNLNVVVRRCVLDEIPGDGIVPVACDGALIEHNIMRNCPRMLEDGEAAAGIWPWSSDNTIIQFNEVSDHKAPWDAQGFDSDWNCRNTIIQYNYSHDNEGGFVLICNAGDTKLPYNIGNHGTIVRYNISVNDGLRATGKHKGFSPTFHISGPCMDNKIYNNIIIVPKKPEEAIDRSIIKMDNWGGPWPQKTLFANNIFQVEDEADFEFGKDKETAFRNNVFQGKYKNLPEDPKAILADPLFGKMLRGGDKGFEVLKAFMLKPGSPCIGSAMPVPDNGSRDFFGNPVPEDGPECIGAQESRQ